MTAVQARIESADGRCPQSDLPPEMCAHCRGHQPDPIFLDATTLDPNEVGPWFSASFDGRCAICDDPISNGDTIAMLRDGSGPACSRHRP